MGHQKTPSKFREFCSTSNRFQTKAGDPWILDIVQVPGALGNGLKRLESAKVGLVANSMQNSIRNMTGTLFLMCGGLILSKLRILDSIWKGNFN